MPVDIVHREEETQPSSLTDRRDRWWIEPTLVVIALVLFVCYSTFRAFENNFFETRDLIEKGFSNIAPFYISPFYSPYIPWKLPIGSYTLSPALYILVFPLSFRLTCYYCRKSYYRSFFMDPPACSVQEPVARKNYKGEREFPFIMQNLHRFALYAAIIIIIFLVKDLYEAFFYKDAAGVTHFGMGVGTLLFLIDVVLVSAYTFSCHSLRHLIGGAVNCFSCSSAAKTRYLLWRIVSKLNERHALWFWTSLLTVASSDLYVRFVSAGIIRDFRFF